MKKDTPTSVMQEIQGPREGEGGGRQTGGIIEPKTMSLISKDRTMTSWS